MRSQICNQGSRKHRFEALEKRLLMAGDVAASVSAGDLTVRGDSDDNVIVISQPSAGTIRIEGRDETTVNGEAFIELPQFADDLRIFMQQGGEDQVSIQGTFDVPDDLRARLGDGTFLVEGSFGPVTIGDDLNVRTAGSATVRNEVQIAGETSITAGGEVAVVAGMATVPDFAAAAFDDGLNINNPYFPLVPGTIWTYESEGVDDETDEPFTETIVVEVLSETRIVDGVEVRIVLDRVFDQEGNLIENTFDWYAQDNDGNVWYFGEDVTNFEYDDQGMLIEENKDGSWEAGVDGAQAGILMEANPRIGHRYYQEFAPGNVLDQGEGVATDETTTTAIGSYDNVFRTEEYSIVEPFGLANKLYAPGVGTVTEFDLDIEDDKVIQTTRLVSLTLNGQAVTELVPTEFDGVNAGGRVTGGVEIDGETKIRAAGPVILNGTEVGDELDVRTKEEAILIDSVLTENAVFAADTLSLKSVFADETIRVGGNADVIIYDSEIHRLKARFGGGRNDVTVRNSVFDRFDANGGGGRNTFEDLGDNDFGKLHLKRFRKV